MAFHTGNISGPLWQYGGLYNFPEKSTSGNPNITEYAHGSQRSSGPITTGSSVVGIKYDQGVIITADTLVSYGSLARYTDIMRVFKINDQTILGAGGDFADFQYIKRYIDQKIIDDLALADKNELKPKSLYNWLTRILYNKRCKFAPLWLDLIVGGMQDGEPFLGHVNMRGKAYQDTAIATGFGQHLALPILREYTDHGKVLDKDTAEALTKKCMEVCYYRDCRGFPEYMQASCTKDGSKVDGPFKVVENWNVAKMIDGY